eukprot:TRINITY_DN5931_c0_g1_i1.p2 TRINITY_DN5931_c0_g1~~TRINITY_DN5931_c0_g1_i1.p2  ORF type:complete len:193 (+),score=34.56 TRINITY_DN5931_c0_g1_i1:296-874(+)
MYSIDSNFLKAAFKKQFKIARAWDAKCKGQPELLEAKPVPPWAPDMQAAFTDTEVEAPPKLPMAGLKTPHDEPWNFLADDDVAHTDQLPTLLKTRRPQSVDIPQSATKPAKFSEASSSQSSQTVPIIPALSMVPKTSGKHSREIRLRNLESRSTSLGFVYPGRKQFATLSSEAYRDHAQSRFAQCSSLTKLR